MQIWSEGFVATGESGPAFCHGEAPGSSLQEACDKLAERDPKFRAHYDRQRMTFWGCRLFDNEADARRSYG